MRTIIASTLLSSNVAQPTKKPFEIYDSRLPGFTLRVQPSGLRSYYARFGRSRRAVDLRHHFASRLVQQGVPLNTVRDLLGHSSVGMSLRYAHLAPDQRREAVAKLNERPLLALSMHLRWMQFPHPPHPPTPTL